MCNVGTCQSGLVLGPEKDRESPTPQHVLEGGTYRLQVLTIVVQEPGAKGSTSSPTPFSPRTHPLSRTVVYGGAGWNNHQPPDRDTSEIETKFEGITFRPSLRNKYLLLSLRVSPVLSDSRGAAPFALRPGLEFGGLKSTPETGVGVPSPVPN